MQGKHSNQNSFFGMIYEELIPADHLLCKLTGAADLGFICELFSDCYCPDKGLRWCCSKSYSCNFRAITCQAQSAMGATVDIPTASVQEGFYNQNGKP